MSVLLLLFVLSSCSVRQKIMDVSIVSMTQTHVPEGMKLSQGPTLESKFCPSSEDKGNIGLFDQAVINAQKTNGVDFITSASFWHENNCVILQGTGQKLISSANNSVETIKH